MGKFLALISLSALILFSDDITAQTSESAEDSSSFHVIYKQALAGGICKVPEGKRWEILSVTVSTGSYPILVNSVKFKDQLVEGDTLVLPFWLAEAELISEGTGAYSYTLKIKEFTIEKRDAELRK